MVSISERMVTRMFSDKLILDQRPERNPSASQEDIWVKSITGRWDRSWGRSMLGVFDLNSVASDKGRVVRSDSSLPSHSLSSLNYILNLFPRPGPKPTVTTKPTGSSLLSLDMNYSFSFLAGQVLSFL